MRKVVIVGQPPVQVLDVTGPLEVFSSAGGYEVVLGNPGKGRTLQTNRNIALAEALTIHEITGAIDTLVIAGGPGSETGSYDPEFVAWIADAAKRSRRVASICTGTFLLGAAGLIDGRNVVTHWKFCDRLASEFPHVIVHPEPIFLQDGPIYTSAGITAGLDLCLALVEEDQGHGAALDIARFLVMFLVRPGGQAQFSHMLSHQAVTSKPLRELQVWMMENLREDLTVEKLADRLGMSTRHFTRVCIKEVKMNPGEFVDRLRVEAAQQMIDSSNMGLKEIADGCGLQTADAMRRTFLRVLGITPREYLHRFKRGSEALELLDGVASEDN
jgi:Transcriptional regulator containing an amidase domain and an AraC-type DNA-binding HTH domain